MPEAEDFVCAICQQVATNRYNWRPRDYERPPVCKSCETISGYSWNGSARHRTKPSGGTFRDQREAMRIGALADAISAEAHQQHWSRQYGIA